MSSLRAADSVAAAVGESVTALPEASGASVDVVVASGPASPSMIAPMLTVYANPSQSLVATQASAHAVGDSTCCVVMAPRDLPRVSLSGTSKAYSGPPSHRSSVVLVLVLVVLDVVERVDVVVVVAVEVVEVELVLVVVEELVVVTEEEEVDVVVVVVVLVDVDANDDVLDEVEVDVLDDVVVAVEVDVDVVLEEVEAVVEVVEIDVDELVVVVELLLVVEEVVVEVDVLCG